MLPVEPEVFETFTLSTTLLFALGVAIVPAPARVKYRTEEKGVVLNVTAPLAALFVMDQPLAKLSDSAIPLSRPLATVIVSAALKPSA